MPLWRYEDQPEEDVCRGCALAATKPEAIAADLMPLVAIALDLAEIRKVGGQFNYPDGLTAVEWQCLRALQYGQAKADELKAERDAKKRKK